MGSSEYHFVTRWRVPGTIEEVAAILADAPDLARWWPAVYLRVREIRPGGPDHVGRIVDLHTRGWLPYTLRWQFRVTESRFPHGFSLDAWGDFVGHGRWAFAQDGDWVDVTYEWDIRADKPLLRFGSPVLRPLFAANHRWAMRKGEESLKLEIVRRHAPSPAARVLVLPPPGAPRWPPVRWLAGALGAGAALFVAVARRGRAPRAAPIDSDPTTPVDPVA